jgi:hypothetical protein
MAERMLHHLFTEHGLQGLITADDVARAAQVFDQLDALMAEITARKTVLAPSSPAMSSVSRPSQYALEQRRPGTIVRRFETG